MTTAVGDGATVYVVEGEKDVEALTAVGVVATCNPGGAGKWRPEHTRALAGASVVVVADRDDTGRTHAHTVAAELSAAGSTVQIVEPVVGKDAADHVAAGHGVDAFTPLEEVDEGQAAVDADGATVVDLSTRRTPDSTPDPEQVLRIEREQFAVIDGSLCQVKRDKKGAPYAKEVLNGQVRVTSRVRRDLGDDAPVHVTHVDLEATSRDGGATAELRNIEVPEFEKVTWASDLPWTDVQYQRTHAGRSAVVNAVLATSGTVPTVTSYAALGWREVDGEWVYIHAGGALGASGARDDVRTDVALSELSEYVLPAPPSDSAELRRCLQASLDVLDRLPARIAAPALGAAYRSVLGECPATLFLVGGPYTFKSSVAALVLSHVMPTAKYNRLTMGAGEDASTVGAAEEIRYVAGHTVVASDDLAPDRGAEKAAQRANQLGRSQYNRSGKARRGRHGGMQATHKPRSLLLLTGEDGASSESAATRMLHVQFTPGDVSRDAVVDLSTRRAGYDRARWTAAMIQHTAAHMPVTDWVEATKTELTGALIDGASGTDAGLQSRTADLVGELGTGWRAMIATARALDVLTQAEAEALWERAWAGLVEAKHTQLSALTETDVTTRAAELLRSALTTGTAHLRDKTTGQAPDSATALWGWEPISGAMAAGEARPRGEAVGWVDGDTLMLDRSAAFAVIERVGRAASAPLGITARALGERLTAAGIATASTESRQRRHYVRRRVAGVLRPVWEVPITWVYPADESPNNVPPSSPATPPQAPQTATDTTPPQSAPEPPVQGSDAGESTSEPHTDDEATMNTMSDQTDAFAAVVAPDLAAVVGRHSGVLDPGPVPLDQGVVGLVQWAADRLTGWEHKYRRAEDPQVWVTPAAAHQLGMGERPKPRAERLSEEEWEFLDEDDRAARTDPHPVQAELEAAGWAVSTAGITGSGWITTWRPGGQTVRVAVIPWLLSDPERTPLIDPDAPEDVWSLAFRLGLYASAVGMPWHISGGVTGVDLMDAIRPRGSRLGLPNPVDPPPPATRLTLEPDIAFWWRPAERWEGQYAHMIDKNGMYLGPAGSHSLGTGSWVHHDNPEFDPSIPAYWLIPADQLEWDDQRWPCPFPAARDDDAVWVTTPTAAYAARDLGRRITPREAYLYPEHARVLEPWKEHLRKVRERLSGTDDPDTRVALAGVKATYTGAIGKLGAPSSAGSPRYRPDHRHHLIAAARANLMRDLAKIHDASGGKLAPVAVMTDALVILTDDPDPYTIPGLKFGTKLGQYKPQGSVRTDEIRELLTMTPEEQRRYRRKGGTDISEVMKDRKL